MTNTDTTGSTAWGGNDGGGANGNGGADLFGEGLLTVVGVTQAEERLYRTLLQHRAGLTLAELQLASQVRAPQVQAAVDALQAKGLISRTPGGDAVRYVAAPPDIALQALLLQHRQQLERAELLAKSLESAYEHAGPGKADPARLIEVVVGREAVLQRFAQVQRTTRREIRIIDKPPYVNPRPEDNIDIEQETLAQGVIWRAIYDPAGLATYHHVTGDLQRLIDAGEQARVFPGAPLKLLISDDRVAMLPLEAAPTGIDSLVIVYPSALLQALTALFEQLWERALPLWTSDTDRAPAPDAPALGELQLLGMLTAGITDEAIAHQLGIGARTVQRRVRALYDRLGARSRSQAVLRATALGWLPARTDTQTPPPAHAAEPPEATP